MDSAARESFDLFGYKFKTVATKFGIQGNPVEDRKTFLQLAQLIYPELKEEIDKELKEFEEQAEFEALSVENLIKKLRILWTPKQWVEMNNAARLAIEFMKTGLTRIGTRLGVEGNPVSDYTCHLAIGEKIFGPDTVEIKTAKIQYAAKRAVEGMEKEDLLAELRTRFPTAEAWLASERTDRRTLKIKGNGLIKIASLLGLEGNPLEDALAYVELGELLYGKEAPLLVAERKRLEALELKPQEIVVKIKEEKPNSKEWLKVTGEKREKWKIGGMTLRRLARKFGEVSSDPVNKTLDFIRLGFHVYGKEDETLKAAEGVALEELEFEAFNVQELKEAVVKQCPDSQSWALMSVAEKSAFKIKHCGLKKIARKLNTPFEPISIHKDHLELGLLIYQNAKPIQRALAIENCEVDKICEMIREQVPNKSTWNKLSQADRLHFKLEGYGIKKIAKKLGFAEDPITYVETHKQMGELIYKEAA